MRQSELDRPLLRSLAKDEIVSDRVARFLINRRQVNQRNRLLP